MMVSAPNGLYMALLSLSFNCCPTSYIHNYSILCTLRKHIIEASRGAEAQSVTVKSTGCRFDPHSRK